MLPESTKSDFDPTLMRQARDKSFQVLQEIARHIFPGMSEESACELAKNHLKENGFEKNWHRPIVRFGVNTLLTYAGKSEPDVVLKENDIFFLDLGPVLHGYEGDVGKTFSIGNDAEMIRCARDVEEIFFAVKNHWQTEKASGEKLYEFAEKIAIEKGWIFIRENASGHRVSDFPHHVYYKGDVAGLNFTPASGIWILEIQIRHPSKSFGAFYEDVLA